MMPLKLLLRTSLLVGLILLLSTGEATAQPSLEGWNSWSNIFSSEPPVPAQEGGDRGGPPIPPSEGGSRGPAEMGDGESGSGIRSNPLAGTVGDLCLMAPLTSLENIEVTQVWTDRPALFWNGHVEKVELQHQESGELIPWQATEEQSSVIYDGDFLLLPGRMYAWLIYPTDAEQPIQVPFVTLTTAQQTRIRQDLYQLEAKGASLEERAERRADYFAERGLWSDFWAELLSVEDPSPELAGLIAEAPDRLCR